MPAHDESGGERGSPAPPRVERAALVGLPIRTATRQGTEACLAELFATALNLDTVGADDDFFALGGNSVQAAAIFAHIQQDLGRRLPLATLYRSPTVRALAAAIENAEQNPEAASNEPAAAGSVVQIRAGTSAHPLFIAPGLGGDIVGLAHVARGLPAGQTVYGLRSVGLLEGEEPLIGVPAIAGAFINDLRQVQPRGPYQLFGVCWGGLVMLEIAQQLQAAGEVVRLLALLDPPPLTSGGNAKATDSSAPSTSRFIARRLELYGTALANKPVSEWPAYIGGRLLNIADGFRRCDMFRGDRTEFLRWRVLQANLQSVRSYNPAPFDGEACLLLTTNRGDGASKVGRDWWLAHLRAAGREVYLPGKDSGDAISAERAGLVAAALCPLLA